MEKGTSLSPAQAMELALKEARRGTGQVSPNPLVGCVVVDKDHCFLASGYHAYCGGDHAEVDALKKVKESLLKECTFYVTLEPCAHEGRTPSCARTLSKYPIKKLIYGLQDPSPLVCGQGVEILKSNGVEAFSWKDLPGEVKKSKEFDSIEKELQDLGEIFFCNVEKKQAFMALKIATSLDGQMALKDGQSRWITGEESRQYSHSLRARYDGVLVGRATLEVDDPQLNIRHPDFAQIENKVIVLDPQGKILSRLEEFSICSVRPLSSVYVVVEKGWSGHTEIYKTAGSASVIPISKLDSGELDLQELSTTLLDCGITSVFVEGGAVTLSSFLTQKMGHRLHLFMAPILLGAGGGISWTKNFSVDTMAERLSLTKTEQISLGKDLYTSFLIP